MANDKSDPSTQSNSSISVVEFLQLPNNEAASGHQALEFVERYLQARSAFVCRQIMDLPLEFSGVSLVEGVVHKYISIMESLGAFVSSKEELLERSEELDSLDATLSSPAPSVDMVSRLLFRPNRRRVMMTRHSRATKDLLTELIRIFNSTSSTNGEVSERYLDFWGFYTPDNSDKSDAELLIREAIELISDCEDISRSARRRIINHLEVALEELLKPKPNWGNFFGTMKEAAIVLGALGSAIAGYQSLHVCHEAHNKIEQATAVVEHTSINVHVLDNSVQIGASNNPTLMLPESVDGAEE